MNKNKESWILDSYREYVSNQQGREETIFWINTVLKNKLNKSEEEVSVTEVEHILDYLMSDDAPRRLKKMSYDEARIAAAKWTISLQKRGKDIVETKDDIEYVYTTKNKGFIIVKLKTKKAYEKEGHLMRHCLGGYAPDDSKQDIYSFRDKTGKPHATIEVTKADNQVNQVKGKGNGAISPKYAEDLVEFLKWLGNDIRPYDMINLGYKHVSKELVPLLNQIKNVQIEKELHLINNEQYIYMLGNNN